MSSMNLERFADTLDQLGGNLSAWPDPQRQAAEALLAASVEARALLNESRALDTALAGLPRIDAAPRLQQQILASVAAMDRSAAHGVASSLTPDRWQHLMDWFAAALWRPVLAGALPLVLGFVAGLTVSTADEQWLEDDVSLMAFTTAFEEYADDE